MTATLVTPLIRDAHPSEYEAVAELTLAAYQQYDAVMPPGSWLAYAASTREILLSDISAARVVALENDTIIGSLLLIPPSELARTGRNAQDYPEIRLVAVSPSARRRGIATSLLKSVIHRTRAEGYPAVGLHSTEYMADAIRIYRRLGFVRATEHDMRTPFGVLVMGFRFDFTSSAEREDGASDE